MDRANQNGEDAIAIYEAAIELGSFTPTELADKANINPDITKRCFARLLGGLNVAAKRQHGGRRITLTPNARIQLRDEVDRLKCEASFEVQPM